MIETFALSAIPEVDEELRGPVREFLKKALSDRPPEQRAGSWMEFDANFSRALAARGWVGVTLPVEYGGGGRSVSARFVIVEKLLAVGAPAAAHWIAERQSGPMILQYGTEAQKSCANS